MGRKITMGAGFKLNYGMHRVVQANDSVESICKKVVEMDYGKDRQTERKRKVEEKKLPCSGW